MLNKCDFEANILILLLFRFNRSKSICLCLGYGIFHTHKTPPFLNTKGFVILSPCSLCACQLRMSQWDVSIRAFPTYIYRENLRKLPYKEVDVTHAWNEYMRLAQSAHVTNQRAFPAGYELRKICFRLDCTFILWKNQLQNRQFPVINELHLVEGRGHAKNTAEKQPNFVGRRKKRTKVWRVHSSAKAKQPHSQSVAMQKFWAWEIYKHQLNS